MSPISARRSEDLYINLVVGLLLLPNLNLLSTLGLRFYNQPVLPLLLITVVTLARLMLGARFRVNAPLLFLGVLAVLLSAYLPSLVDRLGPVRVLTAIGYLAGPIVFLFLYNNAVRIALLPLAAVLALQLVTCTSQYAGVYHALGPVQQVLEAVFVGFATETFAGGRGCSGTYAEPSHLARYALAMLGLIVLAGERHGVQPRVKWSLISLSVLIVIATLSATGLALLIATAALGAGFALVKHATPVQRVVIGSAGTGGAAALALLIAIAGPNVLSTATGGPGVRMFDLVRQISAVASNPEEISFYDLQRFGGYRLINVYVGYASLGPHPFGQGVASYFDTFQQTAAEVDVDLQKVAIWRSDRLHARERLPVKPNSYGAQLVYDFGILGLLAVTGLALFALARTLARSAGPAQAAFVAVGLLQLLFYSTTTIMGPWILLGLLGFRGLDKRAGRPGTAPGTTCSGAKLTSETP